MEITFDGGKIITAHVNGHKIITDRPIDAGGANSAPSPFELFLASIGTCAGIHVKTFCDNRNISTDKIKVIQTEQYDELTGLPTHINIDIQLPVDFPEKYKKAIIALVNFCRVKEEIVNPPKFTVITSNI
jgi:putative redox protein